MAHNSEKMINDITIWNPEKQYFQVKPRSGSPHPPTSHLSAHALEDNKVFAGMMWTVAMAMSFNVFNRDPTTRNLIHYGLRALNDGPASSSLNVILEKGEFLVISF